MLNKLIIGEIINVHGVKGALKVMPLTDDPFRFFKLQDITVIAKTDISKPFAEGTRYKVVSANVTDSLVYLRLYGINDRDKAIKLKGCFLQIPREAAVDLPEDTYFIGDIVNCEVIDICGNDLGMVKEVLQTGSNDVYRVVNNDKREIMIPAIGDVVKDVDIRKGVITVEMLPGLLDVYDSSKGDNDDSD